MVDKEREVAIRVKEVNKTFKLPHEKRSSIKSLLINFRKRRTYEVQEALKDISFEVPKGAFFGIVGRNGSGKSTLLKLLAGIYTEDEGIIQINGRLTPFIELGVGFNMELTGKENVFLNGALLGFNRKEMEAMYDRIVQFAELERFMDQKLKNYSSGMQVRLAFSIAIRANADILLVDEVLAVGDASFQQKCFDVFAELKKRGTTIVLVTHDMNSVLRFCDRVLLIEKGKIISNGKPSDVADQYLAINYEKLEKSQQADNKDDKRQKPRIEKTLVKNEKGDEIHELPPGTKVRIEIYYTNPASLPIHFGFQIFNDAGAYCFGTNSKIANKEPMIKKKGKISLDVSIDLVPGIYYITAATMNENATTVSDYKSKITSFRVTKTTQIEGISLLPIKWDY